MKKPAPLHVSHINAVLQAITIITMCIKSINDDQPIVIPKCTLKLLPMTSRNSPIFH